MRPRTTSTTPAMMHTAAGTSPAGGRSPNHHAASSAAPTISPRTATDTTVGPTVREQAVEDRMPEQLGADGDGGDAQPRAQAEPGQVLPGREGGHEQSVTAATE